MYKFEITVRIILDKKRILNNQSDSIYLKKKKNHRTLSNIMQSILKVKKKKK